MPLPIVIELIVTLALSLTISHIHL